MLYRTVPKNGDQLSILGFGCMRLPMQGGKIDEPRAITQIRHAIDQGVNYVDTAWPYHAGASEIVLGKALQDGYRDKVKLATKLPAWMIRRREDMDRYLAAQLQKLGTDHIDYYLLHSLNGSTFDKLHAHGVEGFLDEVKASGRIVNAGFSFHGLADEFRRIVDAYPFEFCQIQYSYLDEEAQAGTAGLEYAASKGLAVMAMEPLRGGNLGLTPPPPAVDAIWKESPRDWSPAEWALRWVWNRPEITVVLSGMNEEHHIDENLAVAGTAHANSLSSDDIALVKRVSNKYREIMKVGCTGCGYCMPCPAGVAIPLCFDEYNAMHMFGGVEQAKFRYALRASGEVSDTEPGFASRCVECGACIDKCPQHIPIPQTLAQVAAEMEDDQLMQRVAMARSIFKIEVK